MQIINIEIHSEINICFVNVNLKKRHIYVSFCSQVSGSGVKPAHPLTSPDLPLLKWKTYQCRAFVNHINKNACFRRER